METNKPITNFTIPRSPFLKVKSNLFFLFILPCMVQANELPDVASWGKANHGVQLSLTITNSAIEVGSKIKVIIAIKNSSTNSIELNTEEYDLFLLGPKGTAHHLIPPSAEGSDFGGLKLNMNQENKTIIPITLKSAINPGEYVLGVKSRFSVQRSGLFTLDSNLLKVRVTPKKDH